MEKSGWVSTPEERLDSGLRTLALMRKNMEDKDYDNAMFLIWICENCIKAALRKMRGEPE